MGWEPRLAYSYSESSISWDGTTDGRAIVVQPWEETYNLNYYKVSDTFWDAERLIGAYVNVNGAELFGLPQTFEITPDMLQNDSGAERVIVKVSPSPAFPVILSISDGYDEYEQGVYVLLVKAEELQSSFHIPAENDVFAKTIATAPIYKTIPPEYLPNNVKQMTVVINMDESNNYVASATYDEIAAAITSGQTVMCVYGVRAFHLARSTALSDIVPFVSIETHVFLYIEDGGTGIYFNWLEITSGNQVNITTQKLNVATT